MDKKRKGGAERNRDKNKKLLAKCAEKCSQLNSFFCKRTPTEVTDSKNGQFLNGYPAFDSKWIIKSFLTS